MIDLAYAMAKAPEGGQSGGASVLMQFLPFILIAAIFYFILLRPQQKKQKTHQEMLRNLKKGDMVVTTGGIHGIINSLTDTIVNLKVASNVNIDVSRGQIAFKKGDSSEEPK